MRETKNQILFLVFVPIILVQACEPNYFEQKFQFQPPEKCENLSFVEYQTAKANLLAPKWGFEETIVSKCYVEATYRQRTMTWGPRFNTNVVKAKQIYSVDIDICKEIAATKMYDGQQMDTAGGENLYFLNLSNNNKLISLNSTTRLILTDVVAYTDGKIIQIPYFPENILYKEGSFIFNNVTAIWNTMDKCDMEDIGTFDILYTSTLIIIPKTMIVFQRTNETTVGCSTNQTVETLKSGFAILWNDNQEAETIVISENPMLGRKKRSAGKFVTSTEFTTSMVHDFFTKKDGLRCKRSEPSTNYNFNELYENICVFHDQKVDKFWELSQTDIAKALKVYINDAFYFESWKNGSKEFIYSTCLPKSEAFAPPNPDILKQNSEQENESLSKFLEKLNPLYKVLNTVAGAEVLTLTSVTNSNTSEKVQQGIINGTKEVINEIYNKKMVELLTSIYGLLTEPKEFIYRIANIVWDAILDFFSTWKMSLIIGGSILFITVFVFAFCYYFMKGKMSTMQVNYITNEPKQRKITKGQNRNSYVLVPITSDVFAIN